MKKTLAVLLLVMFVLLSACSMPLIVAYPTATPIPSLTPVPLTLTSTATATATITPTPLPPTLTPTPTWAFQPAGEVICPILLYHQISDAGTLYYVSPSDFQAQMDALRDWNYTAIPISLLVKAIMEGASLPPRPVVITFDDGNENVYMNAFPIMHDLGFPGVTYIVSSYLDAKDHLTTAEVLEMVAAGWEVGDHSMTHLNLMDNPAETWTQAEQSRKDLQAALNVPVDTFAYPFGAADAHIMGKISEYGYTAAVGLVGGDVQGPDNLFYLSRIEVPYGATLDDFAALLPWSGSIP